MWQSHVIFSNGVIQYVEINDLKKLFEQFTTILKNDENDQQNIWW